MQQEKAMHMRMQWDRGRDTIRGSGTVGGSFTTEKLDNVQTQQTE